MKNKIIIFGLMILIIITCSASAFADDSLDNSTLTISDNEIESVPIDDEIASSTEITITEENYDDYFNKYTGKLKESVDVNINTVKIGNVSNKAFTIDRPLNIMPSSSDCQIVNGVIHLISGSSGSNITNLVINNTKDAVYQDGLFVCKLHGIWLTNSSDNLISNNTIRIPGEEGCYAMPMGYSSRNKILYNDIESTFTSCILMGSCHYNNISYNRIEIKTTKDLVAADAIYFNCFGHADYSGPADCIGTYISNNFIKNNENGIWAYTLNVLGESHDTVVINNTVVGGYFGIKVYDEWNDGIQAKNILIKNNTVVNSSRSILASSYDVIVENNNIIGSSMEGGILIYEGKNKDNVSVHDNEIIYENLYTAISAGTTANIYNNHIKLSNYGIGINVAGNGSNVTNNQVQVCADEGINIVASNVNVLNNIIHTKSIGIVSKSADKLFKIKLSNNTICGNKIFSEGYAVYIVGYVYNTTVNDNYVETNQSNAFYIDMFVTVDDDNPGNFSENIINGVIENTEILVINDTNFYDYFDEEGYLTYNFKFNSQRILFLTFLSNKNLYFTDPITLTSNKQPNLLYNVTITLTGDASDSTIKDFKFYSFDKESIVLNGVENIVVKDNEFTTLTSDIFESKTISVIGGCDLCNIINNKIFINSKSKFTYAISVSEPTNLLIKKFSHNFTISNNDILIKSTDVAEAMYFDSLVESNITDNNINIRSDESAYGIAICDIMGRPYDFILDSNKIIVNSKEMSYLIELYRVDNCQILNNYLKGTSNGVYSLGLYNSSSIINGNEIVVVGKQLTSSSPADALGKGNSAVHITRQSQVDEFKNNIIDSQNCKIITNENSNIKKIYSNAFVISNYNYDLYFDSKGKLIANTIKKGDKILFKNFTDSKTMEINVPVTIKPYNHLNEFKAILLLSNGSDNSIISGFNFNNANINLNNVSNVLITFNNFTNSDINDYGGFDNNILNNLFNGKSIVFNNCLGDTFGFNNVDSTNGDLIIILNSNETKLFNNTITAQDNLIISNLSNYTSIFNNIINVNGLGNLSIYNAFGAFNDEIINNTMSITSLNGNPTAIYYLNSSENLIKFNRIISNSKDGVDYAIVIDSHGNIVTNNYLISSNGFRRGDDAVNATKCIVHDNLPVNVYVSINGSEEGNGTFENPYPTIKKAIENCLSGAIINILPGMYNESNIVIDKNITLTAINLEGNTYINALNNQLFKIKSNGILTVNALKIFNGFSVDGGSLFNNLGKLMINNSIIYNSSSYYNNSNPTFKYLIKHDPSSYSHDCSNLGVGGAILNRGELIINSSTLYDNFAHKGGAIADFGKTTIKNSLICNNTGVHGGAIYTDSNKNFVIENSEFRDNSAIQTLDYCYIKRTDVNSYEIRYRYLSNCGVLTGMGGAIFSNTILNVNNTLFNHNIAKYGGAIAYDSDLLTSQNYNARSDLDYSGKASKIKYSSSSILNIKNSIFMNNEAKNNYHGNLTMLMDKDYVGYLYSIHATGGAIFGALREFYVYNTTFENNIAESNGGALCVQSLNSSIELSRFLQNTAGERGGALDVFGNFKVFNTEIINNSAKYGGALQYSSYSMYERIQNNMDMFNVTVAGNKALDKAGAFFLGLTNFSIKNSNIYDNSAPNGATFSGEYRPSSSSKIDARGNWWGSIDGPDNSVYQQNNIKFRTWAGQKVDWKNVLIRGSSDSKNEGNGGNDGNNDKNSFTNSVSTGSGVHTGSTLTIDSSSSISGGSGFKFNGNWPNGNNKGNNGGYGVSDGVNPYSSSGNSKTNFKGNAVNPNSLSKTNSSSVNNLPSVGMTSNAADSSLSSQSSSTEGNGNSGNAYEIKKQIRDITELDDSPVYIILYLIIVIMFFFGFYKKYKSRD